MESIEVSVENFSFHHACSCAEKKNTQIESTISFKIQGNFFKAAISDDLLETVDYSELLLRIKQKYLSNFSCVSLKNPQEMRAMVKDFSTLISGGYLKFSCQCSSSFKEWLCLL